MRPLFLILLFGTVGCSRISQDANEDLQKTCGLSPSDRQFPWAVLIHTKVHKIINGVKRSSTTVMPATIISPSHILTSNSIRFVNNSLSVYGFESMDTNGTCQGENLVIIEGDLHSRFQINFEYYKALKDGQLEDLVSRVIVPRGCNQLDSARVMILELKENITFTENVSAACLSNSVNHWLAAEQVPVYGINSSAVFENVQYSPVNCTTVSEPYMCARKIEETKHSCTGDYGGNAVSEVNGRHTILGIFVMANHNCHPGNPDYQFVDVSYYREAICETTGVCVAPPPPTTSGLTTSVPTEAPIDESTTVPSTTTGTSLAPSTTGYSTRAPTISTVAPTTSGYTSETIRAELFPPMKLNNSEDHHASRIEPQNLIDLNIHVYLE
ncbi:hypothetical protein CRE_14252 [Caenorhabditis remanei]|uniref:Peptidase S1 domain-containing protein n=1 Tax=Caenorhabditis remanei TaxID=31234 RepID=E3N7M8_CAERE|nr:hypothetical protein CRE_14252 [Caenorhabditis remanei]